MFNLITKYWRVLHSNEYCIEIIENIGFPKYIFVFEIIDLFSILQSKENRAI
jgi:hypothetical protein